MPQPIPTLIYHITHYRNLPGIVADNGLACCALLRQRGTPYHDLANQEIQDRRATTPVPCGPGGNLHDYVPFYFAPRSPMLYVINRGGLRYSERQVPVIHLVSSAEAVYSANRLTVFTNGLAIMALTDFFTNPADMGQIDWEVMASQIWNDTQVHPGRKRRRQAEFLVKDFFPWPLVTEIGVVNRGIQAQVEALVGKAAHQPRVLVRDDWYY